MLFQIKCDCGHVGLVTGLPRMAHCSACKTTRLFRVNDGYPIIAKLAAVDEETQQSGASKSLTMSAQIGLRPMRTLSRRGEPTIASSAS
jgi:hypothetical protein